MVPLLALSWLESKQKTLPRPMLGSAGFCPPHREALPLQPPQTLLQWQAPCLGPPTPTATSPLGGRPLLLPGQTSCAPVITSACFLSPRALAAGRRNGAHCSHCLFLLQPAPVLTAAHPKASRPVPVRENPDPHLVIIRTSLRQARPLPKAGMHSTIFL